MFLSTVPIVVIYESIGITENEFGGSNIGNRGFFFIIFTALIFAPIIETLIAQQIPILLTQKFIKFSPNVVGIIISSIIFSWLHLSYSIWYAIGIIPTGLLLANTFIIFQKRKESSFWMTSFLHSFRNLIPVIFILTDKFIK